MPKLAENIKKAGNKLFDLVGHGAKLCSQVLAPSSSS